VGRVEISNSLFLQLKSYFRPTSMSGSHQVFVYAIVVLFVFIKVWVFSNY